VTDVALPVRQRVRLVGVAKLVVTLVAAAFAIYLPYLDVRHLPRLDAGDLQIYTTMGLAALVALGLSLLMGFAGQISLGQGAFYALGAYTAGILTAGIDPDDRLLDPEAGIDPLLAVAVAPVVTGVVAAVVGVPLLRLRGHYLAFATLALHLILLAVLFAEDRFTGGQDPGLIITKQLDVAGHVLTREELAAVIWGLVLIALLVALNLVGSRAGRALQAISTSERSAAAVGVNVAAYKLRLFVLAAALAGLAGGLYAFHLQFLSPDAFPLIMSIEFVVMVTVGGLGSVYGAVFGAVAIIWLQQKLQDLGTRPELLGFDLPTQAPQVFRFGVFALILIVVMLFFPRGVLPGLGDTLRRLQRRARRGAAAEPPRPLPGEAEAEEASGAP
jgi:branched-chain amino acid transport system permease protein